MKFICMVIALASFLEGSFFDISISVWARKTFLVKESLYNRSYLPRKPFNIYYIEPDWDN